VVQKTEFFFVPAISSKLKKCPPSEQNEEETIYRNIQYGYG